MTKIIELLKNRWNANNLSDNLRNMTNSIDIDKMIERINQILAINDIN